MPVESLRRDTSPEAKRRENRFILDDDDDEEEDEDDQGVGKRLGRESVMLDGGREGARAMRAASE